MVFWLFFFSPAFKRGFVFQENMVGPSSTIDYAKFDPLAVKEIRSLPIDCSGNSVWVSLNSD